MNMRFFLLLFALAACHPTPPPAPPVDPSDDRSATVAQACEHLRALGCKEGQPTAEGVTCEEVFANVETSGFVTVRPGCLVQLQDCNTDRCTYEAQP
jgi:hypothetical protein